MGFWQPPFRLADVNEAILHFEETQPGLGRGARGMHLELQACQSLGVEPQFGAQEHDATDVWVVTQQAEKIPLKFEAMDPQEIPAQTDVIYRYGARKRRHGEVAGIEAKTCFILHDLANFLLMLLLSRVQTSGCR